MASPQRDQPGGPEIAVVGVSVRDTCGVHDHADLLAAELTRDGIECSSHWLVRRERSLSGSYGEMRSWLRGLEGELESERPRAIVLHYSVFSYSYRGAPVLVPPLVRMLRRLRIPVIGVLHEFAYPWGLGGLRGLVWALTQRAVLADLLGACSALIVTTDWRARWIGSRRLLPHRPVLVAPVFSNLPSPAPGVSPDGTETVVGLFGYSYQGAAVSLVLDAISGLRGNGRQVRLRLLGAPGEDSEAGRAWVAGTAERSMQDALSFTGRLTAQDLSDAIARCDVLLFVDVDGPSPRKGTLAGSLASGRPVIAIDGRHTWRALVSAGAARVVAPEADALAGAIDSLLVDRAGLDALGARGSAFAASEMGVARTAEAVRELLTGRD